MDDLRKAAKMALEALDGWSGYDKWVWPESALEQAKKNTAEAIQALRQELAQPEQEPVGYVTDSGKSAYILLGVDLEDDTPLYTAPPKREWVGLEAEEVGALTVFDGLFYAETPLLADFIRAIETKLKEKNGG